MTLQYYDDSTGQLVEQVDLGGVAQESSIQALVTQMGNVSSKVNSINTVVAALQSRGAVKSVQRGSYHGDFNENESENATSYKDFAINPIDINKSLIIVYTSAHMDISGARSTNGRILSSTMVRIYGNLWNSQNGTRVYNAQWQVIEFY